MTCEEIIKQLKKQANPKNVEGMARFGINPKNTLGIPIPVLRKMAWEIEKKYRENPKQRHQLANDLWETGIHEARILAGLIDLPELVSKKQMDKWARDFDSWDVCDQVCMNLFDKTPFAFAKAKEYAIKKQEFEKRTGFALMAVLASHNKIAKDIDFINFFPLIKKASIDERNFVRKAVNWALRGIGKRNKALNKEAIKLAKEILATGQLAGDKTAKWIANNAIKELSSKAAQERLKK